ncbi:MAG: CBS domain-containing protein [Gemmatimonadetes bacterium]|nr:CBS domain-containing protein [Gemmatimonadota bacterium]
MNSPLLTRLRTQLQRSETVAPVALAVTVGGLAAAGAIVLRGLIRAVQWIFFDQGGRLGSAFEGTWAERAHLLVAPAIGMVVVSWMVRRWAPEAQGHGVPEVQYAIRKLGGRIRSRVAAVKAVASAISIGSGGSVGREGPIVQIGSSLGSTVGQAAGLGPDQTRIMVAAGAAAAIGATFNAPIAGVMFAMEVILGSFAARSFGLVVIASVTSTAISQAALGREPAFRLVETFTLVSEWEFLLYLALGVFTGLIALAYVQSVYWFEDSFDAWSLHPSLKALIGGLGVGALGYFGSDLIFGVGHEGVELSLQGDLALGLMLGLVLLKILATSITLGAGGSGGVFAPALFIGAMAGGAFGKVANQWLPTVTAPPGAYALVGMAALFAAAAHAPITGIIILFEMTDNYRIILPLMFAVVVAHLMASAIYHDSIYSIKLRRKGALAAPKQEAGVLDLLLVTDAMSPEYETVSPELTLGAMADVARDGKIRSWLVVDEEDDLLGIVTETDLERAIVAGSQEDSAIKEIMTTALTTCTPGESLRTAFRRFADRAVYQIPVVEEDDPRKVAGVLRRNEMLWAFKELSEEHQRLLERTGTEVTPRHGESVQMEVQVQEGQQDLCFRRVREIRLPSGTLIVLLRRGERAVVPKGDTRVEPGDVLVLLTTRDQEEAVRSWVGEH